MKNVTKKLMSILGVMLLVAMIMPNFNEALAAESGKIYAVDAEKENLLSADEQSDHAMFDNYGYISLKPEDGKTANLTFNVKVKKAGNYTITVNYTAKEGTASRKMGICANDSKVKQVTLGTAEDWDTFKTYSVSYKLKKGTNKIVISSPSDYDDDTVKTPNIYCVSFKTKTSKKK